MEQELKELCTTFESNLDKYKSSSYDEANTRVDFIDKFFELLDWDVRNVEGYSEDYRDVVREDKVVIEGKPKAPDYSFRIGGVRKFFVEAKKPAVNIKDDIGPAFQVRRYAYTAKLPLSILTDFEEFAVYDTRIKPDQKDRASTARVFYCTYKEYEKEQEFIYNTFSKKAILKGSFDKYVNENKKKKGTSEVDKEFLKMIEEWRSDLARNLALRNLDLDVYNLNNAIQLIIDRIIFLRIAEDRNMEEYGLLSSVLKNDDIYTGLDSIFKRADNKYNSGLFAVKGWISDLKIDNKAIAPIIKGLYYPDCPYELSVLPIEILGHIYEQFLGKTIRLTASHQAKVEEKPEVRKAGGVYYTPQYIVNYIVENTVGEKIKKKKPETIKDLKILDPACGSGSFLVGAFTYLLNYHLQYYTNEKNIKKALKNSNIFQVTDNTYQLSIHEKQKILINNIYGVDIDHQAVEVTKLSLLLKLMEGEQIEAIGRLFKHSDLKLLPDLSNNIKCGNSLIGSDFYEDKNLELFGKEEMRKVNVFDWDKEFPEVFEKGGFDCVIGNPPYFNISTLDKDYYNYLKQKYSEIHTGYNDIMYYFIYTGIHSLNSKGIYGVITSNYYIGNSYAKSLRNFLKNYIIKFINFKDYLVFEDANVHTNIIIANKNPKNDTIIMYEKEASQDFQFEQLEETLKSILLDRIKLKDDWVLGGGEKLLIFEKIKTNSIPLGSLSEIAKGPESGKNNIFTISEVEVKKYSIEKEILKKCIKNSHIKRFYIDYKDLIIIYTDNNFNKSKFPNAYNYLKKFKSELLNRRGPLHKEYEWWRFHRPSIKEVFNAKEKLVVPYRAERNCFAYDNEQYFNNGGDIRALMLKEDVIYNIKYILGILNSNLMNWYYGFIGKPKGKSREYFNEPISIIPIQKISTDNEKKSHNQLVSLVEQMLEVQKKFYSAKTDSDNNLYQQKVDILDKQIDQLVYELYGLTDEEIRIVEG